MQGRSGVFDPASVEYLESIDPSIRGHSRTRGLVGHWADRCGIDGGYAARRLARAVLVDTDDWAQIEGYSAVPRMEEAPANGETHRFRKRRSDPAGSEGSQRDGRDTLVIGTARASFAKET